MKYCIVFLASTFWLTQSAFADRLERLEGNLMKLESSAFQNNGYIPQRYSCQGENISPALSWSNAPQDTKSFALICDDPDAPTQTPWVHWVIFNIPSSTHSLPENVNISSIKFAQTALTSFGKSGYGGPCPPIGHGVHHYHFRLYALDTLFDKGSINSKKELTSAMQGHVLAEAEYVGLYERREGK